MPIQTVTDAPTGVDYDFPIAEYLREVGESAAVDRVGVRFDWPRRRCIVINLIRDFGPTEADERIAEAIANLRNDLPPFIELDIRNVRANRTRTDECEPSASEPPLEWVRYS